MKKVIVFLCLLILVGSMIQPALSKYVTVEIHVEDGGSRVPYATIEIMLGNQIVSRQQADSFGILEYELDDTKKYKICASKDLESNCKSNVSPTSKIVIDIGGGLKPPNFNN